MLMLMLMTLTLMMLIQIHPTSQAIILRQCGYIIDIERVFFDSRLSKGE